MLQFLRSRIVLSLCLAGCVFTTAGAGFTASITDAAEPGDVIRGETFAAAYYLGADGLRYVFPNEATYFTWYDSFREVVWISDFELGKIQIGGNVTYKPGVHMVKINTDPKVYVVSEGGMLHWIETEHLAESIYGQNWSTAVRDIPDAFFANYNVGAPFNGIGAYDRDAVLRDTVDINDDKNLVTATVIHITSSGYTPIDAYVATGQSVRFVNEDTVQHTVTADNLLWGSGTLAPGAEFVHTFEVEGTYPFFDSYNSRHTGAIYVSENFN